MKTKMFQCVVHLRGGAGQARENPSVHERDLTFHCKRGGRAQVRRCQDFERRSAGGFVLVQIEKHESRGVPDLIGKRAVAQDAFLGQNNVSPGRGHARQREAHRVGPEFLIHLDGIDAGSFRLRHLLALGVAHNRMHPDLPEGNLAGKLDPHHDHARNPEKKYVVRRNEQARRIVFPEIGSVVRPAHRRERPQRGTEPGLEHIRVLRQLGRAAMRALYRSLTRNGNLLTIAAMPRGNPMPPPQLARNAPIADVAHPLKIFGAPVFRQDHDVAALDGSDGRLCQWLHLYKPLRRGARFDNGAATVACPHRMCVLGDLIEQAGRIQVRHNSFSRLETVQSRIGSCRGAHFCVIGHDVDFRQFVPAPDFEIVRIVRWGDFYGARPKLAVHDKIVDDWNFPVHQRKKNHFADQMLIAGVARMNGHGGIAEHRFGPRRRNHNKFVRPHDRVANMPEMALPLFVDGFQVADRGAALRAPVHDVVAAINQPVFV